MTETALLATVGLVALLLGAGLGYYLAARRGRQADERTATVEAELNAYRNNVNDHFRETAVHFRALGEQYRSLHEHLAQGAESLCETPRDEERLSFSPLAEIEGPTAGATDETTTIESAGEVVESAPGETATPQVAAAAAAAATSAVTPPVDYELPDGAEAPSGQHAASSDDEAPDQAPADSGAAESKDENRADAASAATDDEPGRADKPAREGEGDEPAIAVTPVDPDSSRAKDEGSSRTIH